MSIVRCCAMRALLLFVPMLLAACATADKKPMSAEQVQETIAQANAAEKIGEHDKALQLLDKAAKESPASKEPWLRTAQIQFDQGRYGPSIVAAQEVLQRDAADRTAQSILAVAGLRVSVQALGVLRTEDGITGSTRSEAQALTASLREALGETVLVPSATAAPEPAATRTPARSASAARRAAQAVRSAPAASGARSSGNPFGALQ